MVVVSPAKHSSTPARAMIGTLTLCAALLATAVSGNELRGNRSPYLAMHGDDPVAWRAWGPAALADARSSGRLLFVTSGYFTCYWCHVMQRESFLDEEIASALNRDFVPVVVDRELHPALDARLIDFVQRTRGAAGWPLNVLITPQGYPLVGITYLPRDAFLEFLGNVRERWSAEREELSALAKRATEQIQRQRTDAAVDPVAKTMWSALRRQFELAADEFNGGFGQQSKFPMTPQMLALLDIFAITQDKALGEFLSLTLERMAYRGLYDVVGDGFFRYTVDPDWREPHFEKMLYDNAQLATLYFRAARIMDDSRWIDVARRTLDFMLTDMWHEQGGFIAALSSVDGRGEEGGYYLWEHAELERVLSEPELALLRGEWFWYELQATHVPGSLPMPNLAASYPDAVRKARSRLARHRAQARVLPRDTKRLAAWNGLALSALAEGLSHDRQRYLQSATALRDFVATSLLGEQRVLREPGDAGQATLDDYVLVARGLLDYSDALDSRRERDLAARITVWAWQRFHVDGGWLTAPDSLLPGGAAMPLFSDDVLPSATAAMSDLLLRLSDVPALAERRADMRSLLRAGSASMLEAPLWSASHIAMLVSEAGPGGVQ